MDLRDARRWLAEKYVWHLGENWRMLRAASARGFGLPGAEFAQPEPGSNVTVTQTSTSNTVTQPPTSPPPAASPPDPAPAPAATAATPAASALALPSWAKTGLVALAGGAASLAGAWGLGKLSPTTPQTPPAAAAPVAPGKATADPLELELQWWTDQDGKVHIGPPTPGKPANPGKAP